MALFLSGVAIATDCSLASSQFPSSSAEKFVCSSRIWSVISIGRCSVAHFETGVTPIFDSSLAEGAATITVTNSSTINPNNYLNVISSLGNGWGLLLDRSVGAYLTSLGRRRS